MSKRALVVVVILGCAAQRTDVNSGASSHEEASPTTSAMPSAAPSSDACTATGGKCISPMATVPCKKQLTATCPTSGDVCCQM